MHSLAYLARQPILDRDGKIFAYELLFRDSPSSDTAVIASDVLATAQVLENVLNNIGLPKLIGEHKAFVNCSREMLLDNLFGLLNPRCFVLEVLEDVEVDDALVKAVAHYHARGFEIALDDFIFNEEFLKRCAPLYPYVSYVKMDLVDNSEEDLANAAAFFKAKNIKILAEKVETKATFKKCLAAGYDYFQGFFFAKPELVTGDVAANLLRFVNSDAQFRSQSISNVRDAIVWIGMRNIQEWLMLMLYARPEMGMTPQSSPLFQNASHRAKFLEILARVVSGTDNDLPAKAFMVGLISRMDALVGAPLENILTEAGADEDIREALLQRSGRLGTFLLLADAVEQDNQTKIIDLLKKLNISSTLLNRCINDAYTWAHEH